jgi:hypothetical protein
MSPTLASAVSSCGKQIDDLLDCGIGAMVGSLEATVGSMSKIGLMVEAAIGEGRAQFVAELVETITFLR